MRRRIKRPDFVESCAKLGVVDIATPVLGSGSDTEMQARHEHELKLRLLSQALDRAAEAESQVRGLRSRIAELEKVDTEKEDR